MNFYRYRIKTVEPGEEPLIETGFVVGKYYSAAAKRLEDITTAPSGESCLVSMELCEINSYSAGAISDAMINEVFDSENMRKE